MRENVRLRKAEESTALGEISVRGVRPSERDFQFAVMSRRSYVVPVAGLVRRDLSAGLERAELDLESLARSAVEAGATVVAVGTDAALFGTGVEDLHAVARAVSVPVLRLDYTVDTRQLYASRLAGADAILLCAGMLSPPRLQQLVDVARSMHLWPVVECRDAGDLEQALRVSGVILGLGDLTGETGTWDAERLVALAALAPERATLLALSGARSPADLERLEGSVDAALFTSVWLGEDEPAAATALFAD